MKEPDKIRLLNRFAGLLKDIRHQDTRVVAEMLEEVINAVVYAYDARYAEAEDDPPMSVASGQA